MNQGKCQFQDQGHKISSTTIKIHVVVVDSVNARVLWYMYATQNEYNEADIKLY